MVILKDMLNAALVTGLLALTFLAGRWTAHRGPNGVVYIKSGWATICDLDTMRDGYMVTTNYMHDSTIANISWSCGDRTKFLRNSNVDREM